MARQNRIKKVSVIIFVLVLGGLFARSFSPSSEAGHVKLLTGLMKEAKVGWHAFTLEGPQLKSDKAFEEGLRIRDRLLNKLR